MPEHWKALDKPLPTVTRREQRRVSRIFTLESQHLVFANGAEVDYERIRAGRGAVLCVPFTGEHFILTVEYAAGIERYALSLVKGKIDRGEDSLQAARRELQEEIGMDAGVLELLKKELSVAPGMLELRMYAYLCTELRASRLEGDEPEPLELVYVTPQQAQELIFDPASELTEARAVAALALALHHLGYLTCHARLPGP